MNTAQTDFHLLNIPNLSKCVGRRALPWKYAQFRMSCVVYLRSFLSVKSRNEVLVRGFQFTKLEAWINACTQRLTSSMLMHPLPVLLNNGVPVALSCDDPSVFGNMGLTFDFYQVRIICDKIWGLFHRCYAGAGCKRDEWVGCNG